MSLGPSEIILILAVVLIFFGPKRLPGLGKALGEGIRSFKSGLNQIADEKTVDEINAASRETKNSVKSEENS